MNIGRFLFRLAFIISGLWGGILWIGVYTKQEVGPDQYYLFFGGLVFIWVCYWVIIGLAKD